ncbi:hypothetical protein [Catenulispora acidiphila]|uniref:hypothetical protein n=1 Tax=Catenulispora acidiphila TaxID=304895 RepID=UPI000A0395AF|nr:hypothetical protein [Catenulispora acidiphila]
MSAQEGNLPWINYLRVPAFLSGLLLLVWFPLIPNLSAPYQRETGLSAGVYLNAGWRSPRDRSTADPADHRRLRRVSSGPADNAVVAVKQSRRRRTRSLVDGGLTQL